MADTFAERLTEFGRRGDYVAVEDAVAQASHAALRAPRVALKLARLRAIQGRITAAIEHIRSADVAEADPGVRLLLDVEATHLGFYLLQWPRAPGRPHLRQG